MKRGAQPVKREKSQNKLRTGDTIDLAIANLDEAGHGIGSASDRQVLVWGALPGETVRAKITSSGHRVCLAVTTKVLRHSRERLMTSPCGGSADCDSCPFIIMKYPAQLGWKRDSVEKALRGYSTLDKVVTCPVIPSPSQLHYRNSAVFSIAGKHDAPVIGIYSQTKRKVTEIGECPLYHPLVNRVITAVQEGIIKGKVPVFSERSGTGLLRRLAVRVAESENRAMAVFITARRSFNEIHHLAKFLRNAVPEVEVVAQNVSTPPGKDLFGEKDYFLTEKKSLISALCDIRFFISPRSLFPLNSSGAHAINEKIREWAGLTGRETVVDLYCGNGGIALCLARWAKEIIGIDHRADALVEANKNARLNGIRNCHFLAGEEKELLSELREDGTHPDLIVINAPHKGCAKDVLQRAAALSPIRLIHLTGSTLSLGRDLEILSRLGYRIQEVQPVDLFPQTPRLYTATLLAKG